MPTEVGNKVFAHLLLFGGHQWWRGMQSLYRPLLTAKINSEMHVGIQLDEAATNVVQRISWDFIDEKSGVLGLRDLREIIACCVGIAEIREQIIVSG